MGLATTEIVKSFSDPMPNIKKYILSCGHCGYVDNIITESYISEKTMNCISCGGLTKCVNKDVVSHYEPIGNSSRFSVTCGHCGVKKDILSTISGRRTKEYTCSNCREKSVGIISKSYENDLPRVTPPRVMPTYVTFAPAIEEVAAEPEVVYSKYIKTRSGSGEFSKYNITCGYCGFKRFDTKSNIATFKDHKKPYLCVNCRNKSVGIIEKVDDDGVVTTNSIGSFKSIWYLSTMEEKEKHHEDPIIKAIRARMGTDAEE